MLHDNWNRDLLFWSERRVNLGAIWLSGCLCRLHYCTLIHAVNWRMNEFLWPRAIWRVIVYHLYFAVRGRSFTRVQCILCANTIVSGTFLPPPCQCSQRSINKGKSNMVLVTMFPGCPGNKLDCFHKHGWQFLEDIVESNQMNSKRAEQAKHRKPSQRVLGETTEEANHEPYSLPVARRANRRAQFSKQRLSFFFSGTSISCPRSWMVPEPETSINDTRIPLKVHYCFVHTFSLSLPSTL